MRVATKLDTPNSRARTTFPHKIELSMLNVDFKMSAVKNDSAMSAKKTKSGM